LRGEWDSGGAWLAVAKDRFSAKKMGYCTPMNVSVENLRGGLPAESIRHYTSAVVHLSFSPVVSTTQVLLRGVVHSVLSYPAMIGYGKGGLPTEPKFSGKRKRHRR
jgi:hypothetical protein